MTTKEEHLVFLDALPIETMTRGMGACQKLRNAFPDLSNRQASQIVAYWMETAHTRKAQQTTPD